ncbi:MAG: FAD binding domain-containing protein [Spirochaetia bacterium]
MSSTRVISAQFECLRPGTLEEALRALEEEGACVLAGGTDLINALKTNLVGPRLLVYSLGIEELAALGWEGGLTIGAAVRLRELELDEGVRGRYPALVEAIRVIGGTQVRNMATLAGNLCNASPGADTPPVLLALGAQVDIASRGADGRPRHETLPLERFFTGPKRTVLGRGQMLASVHLPSPASHSGAAFRRLARVSLDIAKINCAVWMERDGERVAAARIALGSVAPTPVRAPSVEKAILGRSADRELFRTAAGLAGKDITPISDVRSTEAYRRQMAAVLVGEALEEAWQRAGGDL